MQTSIFSVERKPVPEFSTQIFFHLFVANPKTTRGTPGKSWQLNRLRCRFGPGIWDDMPGVIVELHDFAEDIFPDSEDEAEAGIFGLSLLPTYPEAGTYHRRPKKPTVYDRILTSFEDFFGMPWGYAEKGGMLGFS